MTPLADIERAIREARDFSVIERAYLHRATIEDAMGICKGRDRLQSARMIAAAAEPTGPVRILADLGDMIVFETAQGWRGHRWIVREGDRILAETEILDGAARAEACGERDLAAAAAKIGARHPAHAPLGELRAGRGQLAVEDAPQLPPDFPQEARAAARALHRAWNARMLGATAPAWAGPGEAAGDAAAFMLSLFAQLPDAVVMFERALVAGDRVALLWRLHGHHANGRRTRAIGSSVVTMAGAEVMAEEMMIDTLLVAAARHRPLIDLGPIG